MNGYNSHSGMPYNFPPPHQGFPYGSPQVALAHYTGQHQAGGHQTTLQAGTAYPHSGLPAATYPFPMAAQERAKNNLRTSPREPKSNTKSGSNKTAPSAPQNPSGKNNKASTTVKAEDEDLKNKPWTDEEVTVTLRYLFGDLEDGDIGEGKYKEWQKSKSHWNRKMSTELFGGKHAQESIKSKLDRSMKIYKYMVIFEDHTGGVGDGDDGGMSESEKIKVKLDSVRKAGKDVGNITIAKIEKWRTLGWYKMIDRCLGASQNVRRKTTISSVNAPSPFNENDAGDTEQGAEDAELVLSDDDDNSVNGKAIPVNIESDNEDTGGTTGEGERNEDEIDKTAIQAAPKKGEKKRAGPTSTKGVEELLHKKKKGAATAATTSVDPTEFFAANAEFFRAQAGINERSLQLKEKQFNTTSKREDKKVQINLAQNILASDKMEDDPELRQYARAALMKALQTD
ncbi:hypothetical protein FRC01_003963 [Tulasnella sp. 417]|nr:hypothetical protein FRC01_003963 [Tulasnella sp. 417]